MIIRNFPYKYRDYSEMYAEALFAAGDQGKYWEMHDALLRDTPFLGRGILMRYAKEIGLDMEQFARDLDGMKHQVLIDRDKELATSLGIYNTPTFFINGRKVIGNRSFKYMQTIIEEELRYVEEMETRRRGGSPSPVPFDR